MYCIQHLHITHRSLLVFAYPIKTTRHLMLYLLQTFLQSITDFKLCTFSNGNHFPSSIYEVSKTISIKCFLSWLSFIEIIDIECVLLSFLSKKFVSTKWRIEKGILVGPRLLRQGISRGCRECELFFQLKSLGLKMEKKVW